MRPFSPPEFLAEPSGKAERGGVRGGLNARHCPYTTFQPLVFYFSLPLILERTTRTVLSLMPRARAIWSSVLCSSS